MMKRAKRKTLGQHFLKERRILKNIVHIINPQDEELVIEIGAGKGALTRYLAQRGARVIAIEKDRELIPHLEALGYPKVEIINEDVLKLNFKSLSSGKSVKIVGNLPYSISSPILFRILEEKEVISECVFLLQKEVAERVCAEPGSKRYAPLSILIQNEFFTRLHFIVPPSCFLPPPKVDSALISLKKRKRPLYAVDVCSFLIFLRFCFKQRRKKLLNNLKEARMFSPDLGMKEIFHKYRIEENARPEQVSLSQFVGLFKSLEEGLAQKSS